MAKYYFKAKDKKGRLIEGKLDALSANSVASQLSRIDISPLNIEEYESHTKDVEHYLRALFSQTISFEELITFSRQMHHLLKSGVPIVRSLKVILDSTTQAQLRNALASILLSLETGLTLSQSMRNSGMFPGMVCTVVKVGENTGNLDKSFQQITRYLENEYHTKKRLQSAVRYPITVFATIIIAMLIINWFVIPVFQDFFTSMDAELPFATRLLLGMSDFSIQYWYLIIGFLLFSFLGIQSLLKKDKLKMKWDEKKLYVPFIGSIIKRTILARFARSLSMSLKSGIDLYDAIQLVAFSTDNTYVAQKIKSMGKGLEHGESLANTAHVSTLFPPLVMQMLLVGEETGDMSSALDEIAEFFEMEVDHDIKKLGDWLEPLLVLIIAVMVLVLALGVFLPMWDISTVAVDNIRQG